MSQRGSASLVVMVALAFALLFVSLAAEVARVSAVRARVQAAADAAALAAAQELVLPSERAPAEAAREYAERNGAWLVSCRCDAGADEAVVVVEGEVRLPFLSQTRRLRAAARAVVGPGG